MTEKVVTGMKEKSGRLLRLAREHVRLLIAVAAVNSMLYIPQVYAVNINPLENGRKMLSGWAEPIVYMGLTVYGITLPWKRKITEFIAFAGISLVSVMLVFYPETVKSFLGSIVQFLFS